MQLDSAGHLIPSSLITSDQTAACLLAIMLSDDEYWGGTPDPGGSIQGMYDTCSQMRHRWRIEEATMDMTYRALQMVGAGFLLFLMVAGGVAVIQEMLPITLR